MALVSCIVPVHDGARHLAATLDSILAQTHRPVEVVLVDDGSTDESAAIAHAYGPPVRVLRQQRAGQSAARNNGVRAAAGELITFLDADDLFEPEKLARQVAHLERRPELPISLCLVENFWEDPAEDRSAHYEAAGRMRSPYAFSALLARRAVFDEVGLMDERLTHGDRIEWFLRVFDLGIETQVIEEVLVRKRMHATSVTAMDPTVGHLFDIVKARIDSRGGRPA